MERVTREKIIFYRTKIFQASETYVYQFEEKYFVKYFTVVCKHGMLKVLHLHFDAYKKYTEKLA